MIKSNLKKPFIEYKKETDKISKDPENTGSINKKISITSVLSVLGRNVKSLRKIRGFTIKELAKKAKLSATYLQSIEKGMRNVSIKKINSLAETLNVTIYFLLSDIDTRRILKLFEMNKKLKGYSDEELIHMEQLIDNIDYIMSKEIDMGPKNMTAKVIIEDKENI